MRTKIRLFLLIGVMVLLGVGILIGKHHNALQKDKHKNATIEGYTYATLVVDGNSIANEYTKIFSNYVELPYAELPLVDVLLSVGYSVCWLGTTTAILSDGENYLILKCHLYLFDLKY